MEKQFLPCGIHSAFTYSVLSLLIILFLGIQACKKSDTPDEVTGPVLIETQAITVTQDGGDFTINQFRISFPQGALTEPIQMTLDVYDKSTITSDNNTNVLQITNMPVYPIHPIEIRIGNIPLSDSTCIGMETMGIAKPDQSEALHLAIEEGIQTGDTILYRYAAPDNRSNFKSTTEVNRFKAKWYGLSGFGWVTSSNNRFKISVHSDLRYWAYELIQALDAIYDSMGKAPFNFDLSPRTNYPIKINMYKFPPPKKVDKTLEGECVTSWFGINYYHINLNVDKNANGTYEKLKATAFHELYHLVQYYYFTENNSLWLDEATAVYFEQYSVKNEPDYVPATMQGHYFEPYRGYYAGLWDSKGNNNEEFHGYGMASLVKYLVDTKGVQVLRQINEQLKQKKDPIQLIGDFFPGMVYSDWYIDFLHKILTGEVYGSYFTNTILNAISSANSWEMTSMSETSKFFTVTIPHLGGGLIKIDPKKLAATLSDEATMTFAINSSSTGQLNDVHMQLFTGYGSGNQPLVVNGYGTTSLTSSNLKILAENNQKLYLLVIDLKNDVTTKEQITYQLEARLMDQPQVVFWSLRLGMGVQGDMKYIWKSCNDSISYEVDYAGHYTWGQGLGELVQNTPTSYTCFFDVSDYSSGTVDYHYKGNLTLDLNADFSQVTKLYVNMTEAYDLNFTASTNKVYEITATNIPRQIEFGGYMYRVWGTELLSHLTIHSYKEEYINGANVIEKQLLNPIKPPDNSYTGPNIQIELNYYTDQ
jgi:hypothetical protein